MKMLKTVIWAVRQDTCDDVYMFSEGESIGQGGTPGGAVQGMLQGVPMYVGMPQGGPGQGGQPGPDQGRPGGPGQGGPHRRPRQGVGHNAQQQYQLDFQWI